MKSLSALVFATALLLQPPAAHASDGKESNCFFIFCAFACLAGDAAACKKGQPYDPVEFEGGGDGGGDFSGSNGHYGGDTGGSDSEGGDTDGGDTGGSDSEGGDTDGGDNGGGDVGGDDGPPGGGPPGDPN